MSIQRAALEVIEHMRHARTIARDIENAVIKLLADRTELAAALEELMLRCDGAEGVTEDGSNIQTIRAHALLERLNHDRDPS